MALLDNLVEGFAKATGDQGTVNQFTAQRADRRATAHEELQAQTQSILNDVGGLQQRRAALDPKSPTYAKDLAENDKALHDARKTLTDLYHPEQNPGALAHLGGFIRQHLSRNSGTPKPRGWDEKITPGDFKQDMASRIAGLDAAAVTPATANDTNPYAKEKKQLIDAGFSPEDADKAIRHKAGIDKSEAENWVPANVKLADGREVTLQRNSKSGEWTDLAGNPVPKEQLSGASLAPKPAGGGGSKFSQEAGVYENHWGKKIKDWSPEQLTYFNQKMAYDAQHSGASTTTKLEKDEFGNIRPVEVTTTHGPMRPPVEPGASIPKTAGAAKARIPRPAGPSVKVGEPLPFTATTPAITKAQTDFQEATKLASVADQVSKRPDDAVNQKRLAVALERASAGRFTTQALDYIIKAGWGNTIEQWANNPTTGALPSDVLRQLVDGAHQNLQGAKDALAVAHGPAAGGAPAAAASSGKAVSLAKAKLLPAMKGKSDDEIRRAIEASGHTVKP